MIKRTAVFLFVSLVFASQVFGLCIKTADRVHIPKEMVVADNLFAAGKEVIVDGTVTGDLIAFGSQVIINGQVGGSVVAGGENVQINGVVKMDLFSGGKNIVLAEKARVGKDAFLGAEIALISGTIYRDLKIGASKVNLARTAQIKGSVDHAVEKITLAESARIVGKITAYEAPKMEEYKARAKAAKDKFISVGRVISILMISALALLAIFFMPNQVRLVNTQMVSHFWVSILWGIISLVIIPVIAFLLLITLIGLPLSILLLVLYGFGMYISVIFASIVIGRLILDKIFGREISLVWSFFLGLIIIKFIGLVPVIGWVASLIIFFWSFGALVETRFTYYKEARSAGLL